MAFVIALQIAFGTWQLVIYIMNPVTRAAFGWGVVAAKVSAGVLYPTLFFMLLSMSRHFSTFLRRSYLISRFVNWDLSQAFHIRMSCSSRACTLLDISLGRSSTARVRPTRRLWLLPLGQMLSHGHTRPMCAVYQDGQV